jgi:hypothetical protein
MHNTVSETYMHGGVVIRTALDVKGWRNSVFRPFRIRIKYALRRMHTDLTACQLQVNREAPKT